MALGGLLLEGVNKEFWVLLGCLASSDALKQHALIRALQLDVSLSSSWAYLGTVMMKAFMYCQVLKHNNLILLVCSSIETREKSNWHVKHLIVQEA